MQARGLLMIEHRLIEKMLAVIQTRLDLAEREQAIDPYFVDAAVDFIRVYADRTHHGKEEDILFRDLKRSDLSADDLKHMNELIDEHVFGRQTTQALVEANQRYRQGDQAALAQVMDCLKTLAAFYPKHIKKEDDVFFPAVRNYFSAAEDQAMLAEFYAFDRQMIHAKYAAVVEALGGK